MSSSAILQRIVLIGPSGSGKSTVARVLAEKLGYDAFDTDAMVESKIGMSIGEFFRRFGEPPFRALEREALKVACSDSGRVVATGGGVVLDPANWTTMRPDGVIVYLSGRPETLVRRLKAQQQGGDASAVRPLLAENAVARLREQLEVRGPLYRQADVTVETDELDARSVADKVASLAQDRAGSGMIPVLSIDTPVTRSDIYVRSGVSEQVADIISERWPRARTCWLVTDSNVAGKWLGSVRDRLLSSQFEVRPLIVPAGEASKSFGEIQRLAETMTRDGATRRDVVVALGGGVVGDLAGFLAAICLRGLPLVQIPTSLLAMVDSSVGGKTGINTAGGKNLAGAFYQPGIVLVDPSFLSTLPAEEYRSGMAEVIKHAHIQPSTPLGGTSLMERLASAPALEPLPQSMIDEIVTLNVAIKHSVVQADERENRLRMILNFGHTAGHAIEANGYRYRHGEAVALGMLAVGEIGRLTGRVDAAYVGRLEGLLERARLPIQYDGEAAPVLANLVRDKKNVDGRLNWILPRAEGGVEISAEVDDRTIREALEAIGAR